MRLTLGQLLAGEFALLVLFALLSAISWPLQSDSVFLASLLAVQLALHAPVLGFRARHWVPYDEPSDSPVKAYCFLAIGPAAFFGSELASVMR
jgi:hypothetical protein